MTIYAYCRVSTLAQAKANACAMQRGAIGHWATGKGTPIPPECWFEDDGVSGKTMARPAWDALNERAKGGDTIVVYDLSRAARNLLGLLQWVKACKAKGVRVVFIKECLDLGTPMGDLLLGILGAFAQWQAELNAEKAREGMAKGKASGARYGRRFTLTRAQAVELHALAKTEPRGWKVKAAKRFGISPNSLTNYLKRPPTIVPDGSESPCTPDNRANWSPVDPGPSTGPAQAQG